MLVLLALAPPRVNDATIAKARAYFALGNRVPQQLGPTNAADLREALSEDFEFVAPLVGPLGKEALIGATASLDLEAAIPDFDARYHDFRIDADDPNRVWCTMRCRGTHTGTLNFGGIQAEAKSPPVAFESPPEAVSLRFDGAGKLREITTGYPMDRRVGTTGGLGGLFGVLEGIGFPLPPVVTRSCGDLLGPALRLLRLAPPPPEPSLLEVPLGSDALSEERLLELCAALLETDYGAERPELLADSFIFTGPVVGPLGKAEFLSSYGESNLREVSRPTSTCVHRLRGMFTSVCEAGFPGPGVQLPRRARLPLRRQPRLVHLLAQRHALGDAPPPRLELPRKKPMQYVV